MGRKGTKLMAETTVDALVKVGRKGTKRKAVDIHGEGDASNIVPRKIRRGGRNRVVFKCYFIDFFGLQTLL
jgi:hypothetical protein